MLSHKPLENCTTLETGKEIKLEKVNDEIHQLVAIFFIFSLKKKTAAERWL